MVTLVNRAKVATATTGTGTITLGSAESGYQSFADAGVSDGDVVRYVIEDGSDWEIGSGTYTATGTTLSRTVDESSNSDAALSLTGSAVVFITAAAEDVFQGELFAENYDGTSTKPSATGTNAVAIGKNATATQGSNISVGASSDATGTLSSSFGIAADSAGGYSTALGYASGTSSLGSYSLAAGASAQTAGTYAVALPNSYASGNTSFAAAIGNNTSSYGATGANSVAIGDLAKATANNSIAIGDTATSTVANQIALGGTSDTVKISGTYTLPTTDGTNGQVLTTDGSGAVTFADAGGGGGDPDLYRDNAVSATTPTASGANAIAIGDNTTASGEDAVAIGDNIVASGLRSISLGGFSDATGDYSVALGAGAQALGENAVAIKGNANYQRTTAIGMNGGGGKSIAGVSNTNTGGATALGGSYAGALDSFAAAIANNTSSYGATGANSVAIGQLAKATGANGLALGRDTEATATQAVAVGRNVVASGSFSAAFGTDSTASASYSTVIGHQGVSDIVGKIVFAGGYDFSANGDVQQGVFILRSDTTDATPEALTTNNSTAGTTNQVILSNNSAYAFHGTIVARQQASAGTASAAWKVEGLIRREGSAGTTVLVNSATTVLDNTPSWGLALSADTTNGGLKIEATGAASTNIRWVATINTSEVTYA